MDNQEWHEWRKQGVGASDSIVLMDCVPSSWGREAINTPYKLWCNKTQELQAKENDSMKFGKENEAKGIAWFGREIGETFLSDQPYEHPEKKHMRATFDAINMDESISMELKICNKEVYEQIEAGIIPETYRPQVIHQKFVKPTKHHFLVGYRPNSDEGVYLEVKEEPDYLAEIIKRADNFWFNHVIPRIPPDKTELDKLIVEEQEAIAMAFQIYEHNLSIKSHEEKVEKLKSKILDQYGWNYMEVGPYTITPNKPEAGRISYKDAPEEVQKILEQFRGPPIQKKPTFRLTER